MVSGLIRPAAVHVHVSSGHDRVVHDHGLAAHDHYSDEHENHAVRRSRTGESVATIRDVNGHHARHVVFLRVATTTATTTFTMPFEVVEFRVLPMDARCSGAIVLVEPRQHSPPACVAVPARAPPSLPTA